MTWPYARLEKQLLKKRGSLKDYPFGPEVVVFKVAGKMFALANPDTVPLRVNLKCHPEEAEL